MTNFEVDRCLESMTLLIDSREQPTKRQQDRLEVIGLPFRRCKLNVGDYSCSCTLPDGSDLDFSSHVVVERKMDLDELCMCFGKDRKRFQREFERAKDGGIKVFLLVEDATWEKIYNHKYKSQYNPKALEASIDAYRARYEMDVDFCKSEITGKRIHDILYRELKEYLERGPANGI